MRRLRKCFILCSGVFLCLLLNTFFTQKIKAAAAPTSGWLNCSTKATNTTIEFWSVPNNQIITAPCGGWTNIFQTNVDRSFFRANIKMGNTSYQGINLDSEAYAIVTFGTAYTSSNTLVTSGWIGRNVSVLEQNFTTTKPPGSVDSITPSLQDYNISAPTLYTIWQLKIKIPKGQWNGYLDLQTSLELDSPANFAFYFSEVRMQWIDPPLGSVDKEAEKELEDRNNLESQSQQTDSDANNSEQQMQSGTSSLISVVTSFSNAMIGVRRTNCKLPRMTAYDFDLGELDLCTYSPPAWIQTITSAVVSLIVVKLAYKIFKRIMGIAKGISQ